MPRPQHEQAGLLLLRRALEDGADHDVLSAVAMLGLHRQTCREYLTILHRAKLTHIVAWRQSNQRGRWYAAYRWGKGENAPKPGDEERLARRRLKRTVDARGITWAMLFGVSS